jgi:hypothetical protein
VHRFTRFAVIVLALAAGHAGVSAAHPAATRSCGAIRVDGGPVGITVQRGKVPCSTARKILKTYLRSHAPCSGSACQRKHARWTCLSAKHADWPRLASCTRGNRAIAAYAPAD